MIWQVPAKINKEWQLKVWYEGFERKDASWQPLEQMWEDVPELVEKFLEKEIDHGNEDGVLLRKWHFAINKRDRADRGTSILMCFVARPQNFPIRKLFPN